MNLRDLLLAVKDEKLSKEQIEKYRDEMIHLFTAICLELAEKKKLEALYFVKHMNPQVSDISIKRTWRASPEGQRLLELEAYKTALPKEIDSLKSRVYALL